MRASILDLRQKMGDVLRALDRNEPVTILHRGKEKGVIYPVNTPNQTSGSLNQHAAFGVWSDHPAMEDVGDAVRRLREGRCRAV